MKLNILGRGGKRQRVLIGVLCLVVIAYAVLQHGNVQHSDYENADDTTAVKNIPVRTDTIPNLKLNVTFLPQVPPGNWTYTMNCIPACYAMLYSYKNNVKPTSRMIMDFDDWAYKVKKLPVNKYNGYYKGYRFYLLELYSDFLGINHYSFTRGNLPALIQLLKEGKPVIIFANLRMASYNPWKIRHAMVAVGISPKGIVVHDPSTSRGAYNVYSFDKFLKSWKSTHYSMFYME